MKKIMVILLFILITTSAFCGIGVGCNISFGPPWQNSEELSWGVGAGAYVSYDLFYMSPFFIQLWMDANYYNWNNYSIFTDDEWLHEFASFFPGVRAIWNIFDSDYPSGIYVEGGADISLDFWTFNGPFVDDDDSNMDMMIGGVLGAGIVGTLDFLLIRVGVQVHLIEKIHVTFPMTVGVYFRF